MRPLLPPSLKPPALPGDTYFNDGAHELQQESLYRSCPGSRKALSVELLLNCNRLSFAHLIGVLGKRHVDAGD